MRVADGGAERAPRNRYVDFVRAAAICLVVLGHWLATSISVHGGALAGANAVDSLPWTRWLTLVLQVMPLFFLAGGYANATSWTSHHGRGQDWLSWLHARTARLLRPTSLYLVAATVGVAAARAAGIDPSVLVTAAWAIGIQLWFLPVYIALVTITPLTHAAHRRWGMWVVAAFALGAIAVDAVVLVLHVSAIGTVNYLLVWGTAYQLGFAWRDGVLTSPRWRPYALAAVGVGGLAALLWLGPYPVSMIGVAGERIDNTSPPSAALLAFCVALTGVALILEAPVSRWLRRPRPWLAVVRVNTVVMTLFLWHMVPVIIAAPLLYLSGLVSEPVIGSAHWWELRLAWVAVLLALLVPIVAVVGRWEHPRAPVSSAEVATAHTWTAPLLLGGLAAIGYALSSLAVGGFDPSGHLPVVALACYAAGAMLVLAAYDVHGRWHRVGRPTGGDLPAIDLSKARPSGSTGSA